MSHLSQLQQQQQLYAINAECLLAVHWSDCSAFFSKHWQASGACKCSHKTDYYQRYTFLQLFPFHSFVKFYFHSFVKFPFHSFVKFSIHSFLKFFLSSLQAFIFFVTKINKMLEILEWTTMKLV